MPSYPTFAARTHLVVWLAVRWFATKIADVVRQLVPLKVCCDRKGSNQKEQRFDFEISRNVNFKATFFSRAFWGYEQRLDECGVTSTSWGNNTCSRSQVGFARLCKDFVQFDLFKFVHCSSFFWLWNVLGAFGRSCSCSWSSLFPFFGFQDVAINCMDGASCLASGAHVSLMLSFRMEVRISACWSAQEYSTRSILRV